jgi:hypothetical protein
MIAITTSSSTKLLAITGNLDLSALGNTLNVIDLGKTGTSWLLATVTGTLTGTFESVTGGYTVDYGVMTPGQLRLNFAGGVAGDYNQDGTVNAADYVVWREATSVGLTSLPNEGGISLGSVDAADYNFWRSRFGATSAAGSGSAMGGAAVPEPTTGLLGGYGLRCADERRPIAVAEIVTATQTRKRRRSPLSQTCSFAIVVGKRTRLNSFGRIPQRLSLSDSHG